jgi:hypothetical protein
LVPAGKSLSKAARGSAAGCSAFAARNGCATQRIKVKKAMYRNMQGAPQLNCLDPRQ